MRSVTVNSKRATQMLVLFACVSAAVFIGFYPEITNASVHVQCPGDSNGDAIIDAATTTPYFYPSDARCMHITGGDGFLKMADGQSLYNFGFHDVTGILEDDVINSAELKHDFPGPTIMLDEGDQFYLTLTNAGLKMRADLFDPHTVHWHGFPEAATVFDGVPDVSLSVNQKASLTYFYQAAEPGTYSYHCHVEATEHMQMGMLANLYVRPKQNRLPDGTCLGTVGSGGCSGWIHHNPDYKTDRNQDDPLVGDKYVYNDGDGSTRYDVEYPIQIGSMDSNFHTQHINIQPLPFAGMKDDYPMLNGRGYPDTVVTGTFVAPPGTSGYVTQSMSSRIDATAGQKILLRISNLNVTRFYTLTTLGLPAMKVVGRGARLLRGPGGADLSYETNSLDVAGGEAYDVIIDTTGLASGTYYLYTSNLNYLSNKDEDYGGMMTEIHIN